MKFFTVTDREAAEPETHVDDEYARAGVFDPKILITTSRDPSSRLQQFSKVRDDAFGDDRRCANVL
jgi:U3 small nucleolar ribonucleoprotein protein IMP4